MSKNKKERIKLTECSKDCTGQSENAPKPDEAKEGENPEGAEAAPAEPGAEAPAEAPAEEAAPAEAPAEGEAESAA